MFSVAAVPLQHLGEDVLTLMGRGPPISVINLSDMYVAMSTGEAPFDKALFA